MDIAGLEGMSVEQLADELRRGGRFVVFEYVISIVLITFTRSSGVYYLRPGQSALSVGWQYILLTLVLGWWGIPWGLIRTPIALIKNLRGATDVTATVMDTALGQKVREAQGRPAPPMPSAPAYVPPSPALAAQPAVSATPVTSITCPNCGASQRPGAVICGQCGARLAPGGVEESRRCPGCGAAVEEDWRACPRCGEKLIIECPQCGERVERHWRTCPFCEAPLAAAEPDSPEVMAAPDAGGPRPCPECGEPVQPDWPICPACTARLIVTCPGCGERMERDWKTCPFCETELS